MAGLVRNLVAMKSDRGGSAAVSKAEKEQKLPESLFGFDESFGVRDNAGETVDFSRFVGKVCLVVNVASACSHTKVFARSSLFFAFSSFSLPLSAPFSLFPECAASRYLCWFLCSCDPSFCLTRKKCVFQLNYDDLKPFADEMAASGKFELLAFPCNQFLKQEKGSDHEICEFVQSKGGDNWALFQKVKVNGPSASPVYLFLKRALPGRISWNFDKVCPIPPPACCHSPKRGRLLTG
jgi:glutathione peroxidase-family protein